MKKDKFSIFENIILREQANNNFGIYITIGQLARIINIVDLIYERWNDTLTENQNIDKYYQRCVSPIGDACITNINHPTLNLTI